MTGRELLSGRGPRRGMFQIWAAREGIRCLVYKEMNILTVLSPSVMGSPGRCKVAAWRTVPVIPPLQPAPAHPRSRP